MTSSTEHQTGSPIAVLGAGSWGTALALSLAGGGREVRLWGHREAHMQSIAQARENTQHLPGIAFPESISIHTDLAQALTEPVRDVLLAVPFKGLPEVLTRIEQARDRRLIVTCKGIQPETGKLAHRVVHDCLGDQAMVAVLSGPTFAGELARGMPSAAVLACQIPGLASELAEDLHSRTFRIYSGEDVIGVELAGALKNVLAIAAGISDGLGFGANARAALITRGLAEIARMGVALGARADTFAGLAGVGDVVLTCTDDQSRNRRLGLALAQGRDLRSACEAIGQVTEGVPTARAAIGLARDQGVDMPVATQVHRILEGEISAHAAVSELLAREPRPEL